MKRRCPVCGTVVHTPFHEHTREETFPFCSQRCKLVDLGSWLDSGYRIISRLDRPSDSPSEDIEGKQQV